MWQSMQDIISENFFSDSCNFLELTPDFFVKIV